MRIAYSCVSMEPPVCKLPPILDDTQFCWASEHFGGYGG